MKSDVSGKQGLSNNKEEQKKMRPGIAGPPQLTLDPERRRDFFNRLLEKYSTKSTKISSPTSGIGFGPRSARFPSVPPTKTPVKLKDKFLKKKKSSSDRSIVRSATADDLTGLDPMDSWKNSIKNHQYDTSVYKNHVRIRARFPYPLPIIEEVTEPMNTSEKKNNKKYVLEDFAEKESKSIRDLRAPDDGKSSGEGEDRPLSKKSGKVRRNKIKKNSSAQEMEESSKLVKPSSQEIKTNIKPSSSSLPHLGQDDGKSSKKLNDKVKKPKKLTKKQTFTLVTSKPPV